MSDLLSVVIGGALAIGGTISVRLWEKRRERIALGAALCAEISTIIKMSDARGYEQMFRDAATHVRATRTVNLPTIFGSEDIRDDPVFAKNVDKIGLLGPELAADVVKFYAIAEGIRIDLRSAARGEFTKMPPTDVANLIDQDLALWIEAKVIGKSIEDRLS